MRKFFRTPLNWFADKTDSAQPAFGVHDATLEEPVNQASEFGLDEAAEVTLELTEIIEHEAPQLDVVVQFNTMVSEPIIEVIEVREPGPVVRLMKRGPRLYSICPHCEASWSLRDRLFDPRTGRPCALETLVCPGCLKPVSVPGDLDLRKVQ